MSKYYIDYETGAGNEWVEGSLDDAMRAAEEGAAYTGLSICIYHEADLELKETAAYETYSAMLPWWSLKAGEEDNPLIDYGDFGFYGQWINCAGDEIR